ncbi:competence protein ComEA [Arthrobacter sp. yr096]|uniref:helix-hairpin-helix domain-containing protein n=1 Tax=unclassified Arthrobacter TaxID=235627 RepID=UPI00089ACCC2|nr:MULTISPECIES: helix-hairpin-helix domain-containing protein [unclassified Arthrobacter]SDW50158.1 competence protein ComEA [Arthrobacter sp. cf158]SEJ06755.1 competence protein ComEA [Arthrobacter sp. yr096]
MPRRNRDAAPDAAAQAVRQRFASRMGTDTTETSLLQLPVEPDQAPDDSCSESQARSARTRWRTPWRVAVVVAMVGAGIMAWHVWHSAAEQPTSEPLSRSTSSSPGPPDQSSSPQPVATDAEASTKLLVHVAGAVQKPGVVSLPPGSRVFQAIDAAGGATTNAELGGLNLAEVVQDGAKVRVPALGEAEQPSPSAPAGSASGSTGNSTGGGAKININTASLEELGTLPRVGPVTAQRIVDWRKEHGQFASVDELDAVDGIGPKLMESLKDLVTVQGG